MNREQAINYLRSSGMSNEQIESVCEGLGCLEERPQGERWIPVSERLPDKNGKYLVTEKHFAFDDKKHNGYSRLYVDKIEFSDGSFHRASFIEVIAWMPLPEPYKEAEE